MDEYLQLTELNKKNNADKSEWINKIKSLLPSDFTTYTDLRVNGQTIPLLAKSHEHGVVAIFFIDMMEILSEVINFKYGYPINFHEAPEKNKTTLLIDNPANIFASTLSIPTGINSPNEKYLIENPRTVIYRGVITLTIIFNYKQCLKSKSYSYFFSNQENRIGNDSESKYEKLSQLLNAFTETSITERCPLEIEWANSKIAQWLPLERTQKKQITFTDREIFKKLKLSNTQKVLVEHRAKCRFRRIKGSAGSGKTLVLAARGAKLLNEGKRVLFLSYNIVTRNYIMDTVYNILQFYGNSFDQKNAEFRHFHGLLGTITPYNKNIKGNEIDDYLTYGWFDEAMQALNRGRDERLLNFDAILIDEGQDFYSNWLELILQLKSNDTEFIFITDDTQNIYDRIRCTENELVTFGFREAWVVLQGSYRLPYAVVEPAKQFAQYFIRDIDMDLPSSPEDKQYNLVQNFYMRWVQISDSPNPDNAATVAYNEYNKIKEKSLLHHGISIKEEDVIFLVRTNTYGWALETNLSLVDIPYYSTIGDSDAKKGFHISLPLVKLTTIKSFKGMESSIIILLIESRKKETKISAKEIYVALTRIVEKKNRPSFITVICQNSEYADYGKTWEKYGGEFIDLRKEDLTYLSSKLFIESSSRQKEDLLFSHEFFKMIVQHGTRKEGSSELNVYSNIFNSPEQNTAYLHDYFFRSYTESFVFWNKMFSNSVYKEHLSSKNGIKFLSYGCGTGGDIAGFLGAIHKHNLFSGKTVEVYAIDGNEDALKKCENILNSLLTYWNVSFYYKLEKFQHVVKKNNFEEGLKNFSVSFDIIETSKMINELISSEYAAYHQFLYRIVNKYLKSDGLALITDVPIPRWTHIENNYQKFDEKAEKLWTPNLLSDAAAKFIKNSYGRFSILLPIPCNKCKQYFCYSATVYSYRFFSENAPLIKSPVCCRVIVGNRLAEKIQLPIQQGQYFKTCYHKDGSISACQYSYDGEKNVSDDKTIEEAPDGYTLI